MSRIQPAYQSLEGANQPFYGFDKIVHLLYHGNLVTQPVNEVIHIGHGIIGNIGTDKIHQAFRNKTVSVKLPFLHIILPVPLLLVSRQVLVGRKLINNVFIKPLIAESLFYDR